MTLNVIDEVLAERFINEGMVLLNKFNCEKEGIWKFNVPDTFSIEFEKGFADRCFISNDLKLTF